MRTVVLDDHSSKKPIFIFVLIIIMAASAVYLMVTGRGGYQKAENPAQEGSPAYQAEQESGSLLDRVKNHILITEQEAPRIYTINNIDLVRQKNPAFYENAEQGDRVLIWKDRAIIYSEKLDRIVAVATAAPLVRLSEEDAAAQEGGMPPATSIDQLRASTTIEIRNGSRKNGEASRLKQTLTEAGFMITKIGDAGAVYAGTQIIDLTGGSAMPIVEALLEPTNGSVTSTVPVTERPSEANILILIGR
jgi:hypothetical protein